MATVRDTISLQDKMTPVLKTINKALQSTVIALAGVDKVSNAAFTKVENDVKAASDAIDNLSGSMKDIPPKQQKVETGFKGWEKAIIVLNQGISLFKNTLSRMGFMDFDRAFRRMDVMTNFERTMTIVTGSSDAAKVVLNELNESVLGTAYGLDVVANASKNLATRGVGLKKSTELITTWLDAVSFYGEGTNDELERTMDVLGKIISSGKVHANQLNILTNIGINATDMYAKAVGKSYGEVQKALSTGKISSVEFVETVTKAMQEGTNGVHKVTGAAKDAGMTWATTFANMKAASARGLISVIEHIDKALEKFGFGETAIMGFLRNIGKAVETMYKNIGTFIYKIMVVYKENIETIINTVKTAFGIIKENLNLLPPLLGALTIAFTGAKISAWLYSIAQKEVNKQMMIMQIRMALVGALIMVAIYAFREWGTAGKVLAFVLGIVATALFIATIAQHAFNTALWLNPIVWVIALIVGLIAIIIYLWQTNLDFKYGIIKIWNSILNFFDQVPIFLTGVANGIVDAFEWAKSKVLEILQAMGNGVIKIINNLIDALNKIPGVAIDPLQELTF